MKNGARYSEGMILRVDRRAGSPGHPNLWLGLRIATTMLVWVAAYSHLESVAAWLTYDLLHLRSGTPLAGAVDFFATDVPKIFLLLSGIVTVVTVIRSYFPPERVKKVLAGKGEFVGTVLAALLGTITPSARVRRCRSLLASSKQVCRWP